MNHAAASDLFAPLDLEQGLHLLDVMTWFPESGTDRWERVAEYIASNCSGRAAPSAAVCSDVTARVLATGPAGDGGGSRGRWADIPQAKWLYQVKYDLMSVLYPDDWFVFMNMGHAGADFAFDDRLPPHERIWQPAANLYASVVGQADLRGCRVLEVGSGRGGGAAWISRELAPAHLVGLDYSPNNVAFCRRVHSRERLEFEQGDAEHLPFPDASFDAVVNVESAHCYPDVDAFFAEVRRVLRPGGHLLFADEWWADQRTRVGEMISAAGLEILDQTDLTTGIIRALRLLGSETGELIDQIADEGRRAVYRRFFHERVCQQSAYSYTSGRFVFLQVLARRRDPAGD